MKVSCICQSFYYYKASREQRTMKNKIFFIDLLNYLLGYKNIKTEELLRILDNYFQDLNIPYVLCVQKGKGFDWISHKYIYFFNSKMGLDDDQQILQLARRNDGYIVSNDRFREYSEFAGFVGRRRIAHNIRNGKLELYIPEKRYNERHIPKTLNSSLNVSA